MRCPQCQREVSPAESECPVCKVPLGRKIEPLKRYNSNGGEEEIVSLPTSMGGVPQSGPAAAPAEVIDMKANRKYMNRDCPQCLKTIFFGDDIKVCTGCDTAYHAACFQVEGCTSQACQSTVTRPLGRRQLGPDEKFCPMCGEPIKKIAIKCKHCNSVVDQSFAEQQVQEGMPKAVKENTGRNSIIFGVLGILFCFGLLGVVFGILAIKFGNEAQGDPAQAGSGRTGKTLGIIGLVLFGLVVMGSCAVGFMEGISG